MAEATPVRAQRPDRPLSPLGLGVIGATVAIDQVSKVIAERTLELGQPVEILPVLSLYRAHNTGIAFSLFSDHPTIGLIALTAIVTAIVAAIWQRSADGGRPAAIGYALIIGGALGNLIDRLLHGHVVDFLFLHLGERPLFVFNLADTALTIGPALLVAVFLLPGRRPPRGTGNPVPPPA